MDNCVFPIEIIDTIAWYDRRVYLALNATCKRVHEALGWIRARESKRFIRRWVSVYPYYTYIRDLYWLSLDLVDESANVTFWTYPSDMIIVIKRCKYETVIQYNWNGGKDTSNLRKVTNNRDYAEVFEPITPDTTFEQELLNWTDSSKYDLMITYSPSA
ncbi:hypothetical protein F-liban_8 [Faustovirus]|nr:hypothetical protein F-liban_8 [Faustovirus]